MKWRFFIIMMTLQLVQVSIYAQHTNNKRTDENKLSKESDDEKMFKNLNLSEEQKSKIQAIRRNNKISWKANKDVLETQNVVLISTATKQDSIYNLLSPSQKVKMRKYEMKENYTESLKQKFILSLNQKDKMEDVCEQAYDKQQALINNSSLSQEDLKQQIGKLNTDTSNKITDLLTAEQKKKLQTEKEKQF